MKASQWIDRIKTAKGWESDYRVSQELHITRQAISQYRSRDSTFDEQVSVRVALVLGIDPAGVVIDQAAERVKDQGVRTALARIADRLCILCKVAGAIVGTSPHRKACAFLVL